MKAESALGVNGSNSKSLETAPHSQPEGALRARGTSPHRHHWSLDPTVTFLNHGSFGACPIDILCLQQELRARLERDPVRFIQRELPALQHESAAKLAAMVGVAPTDHVFVANATTGVGTVLRSLKFQAGDELLTTDHSYGSCRNAMARAAQRDGAQLVIATVPFPVQSPDQITEAILSAVTPRTRLAMISHITSPTALIFPIREIVAALAERGIDTLVDGAHSPGMLALDLPQIGAAYYTGNCHKWLCTPKGAGFLYVRPDKQEELIPADVKDRHGKGTSHNGLSAFQQAFGWPGTIDPTPWLCVGPSIDWVRSFFSGGLEEWQQRNHELVVAARRHLCTAWETPVPCPETMLGSMAVVPLPHYDADALPTPPGEWGNPLQGLLFERDGIEVPLVGWQGVPCGAARISAQAYNTIDDYEKLAAAVRECIQPAQRDAQGRSSGR